MPKVRVARSAIHGQGVVAVTALRRGEVAFRLRGSLVPWRRVSPNGIQVWRDWYLEPRPPGRYVNHACRPNAEVTAGLDVRARRRIARGEELTIDYCSVVLWEPWRLRCRCGDRACRGVVRAWGRSTPKVRRRYPAPLFAWVERGRVPAATPTALRGPAREAALRTPRGTSRPKRRRRRAR